jgi:2-methylaconitate cis-trans-isomerase PrpF
MTEAIPAVLMRGGTSKGVFLHARDIPLAGPQRDALLLGLLGSPDPMQIDGLGGTTSSTSKVMIVEPGPGPVISYWFGQVGISDPTVDWSSNCGNLTAAVAAFAVDEGLVPATEPLTRVLLLNGNTGVRVEAEVHVRAGRARTTGEQWIAGVPWPGSPITTNYLDPGGSVTGRLFPTGNPIDTVDVGGGPVDLSIVDVASAYVFARASSLGVVAGARSVAELNSDRGLLAGLERLRGEAARLMGVVDASADAASQSPAVPRIVLIAPGTDPAVAELDVVAVSMGAVHRALPGTAAVCLAAAAQLPGTIPNLCRTSSGDHLVLRHPLGTVDVRAEVRLRPQPRVVSAGVVRTARRLMSGLAYPRS